MHVYTAKLSALPSCTVTYVVWHVSYWPFAAAAFTFK